MTLEPVFDERLAAARVIAEAHSFRLADLLMKKREADTEERSKDDTFMTGHGKRYDDIESRLTALNKSGCKVWCYKIEDSILNSRIDDKLGLLASGA